jgi:endonuclease/exonuclease/phosphatase family metal-dependent hydrolase
LRAPRVALVLLLLTTLAARAGELKIATWNLNWLTTRAGDLPTDVKTRSPEDFERLHAYAQELNADLVAIEEVDSAETARRLFPSDIYSVHMSHDRVRQRVGVVVRRGLRYDVNPDVTAIALDPLAHLRSGVDITLKPADAPLRLLAIHLKQGCQYFAYGRKMPDTCQMLLAQFSIVAEWIAARRDEGVPFIVLGDFNRELDRNGPFLRKIRDAAPFVRATEGFGSPCWGHESFIDHILIGGPARDWLRPGSLRVLTYRETEPAQKEHLSDHCPVSVRLTLPD